MIVNNKGLKKFSTYFWISLLICSAYFVIFIFPNHVASENMKMVAVFEPDEYYPLPFVFDMIRPADSIGQAITHFIFYRYYFYGFPYFGASALAVLPLSLLGKLGNTSLVMVFLRQFISVLPILGAILLLVHIQTQFRSYKSIVLLIFLLSIPAVVANNFWWHPDGIAILFSMLVIFFLNRDGLRFGRDFYLAAVMCGFSAAAKLIGFYFFLSIFAYILYAAFTKKRSLKSLLGVSFAFIACMGIAFVFANPMLLSRSARVAYFTTMQKETMLISSGYETVYAKGFLASLPLLTEYYGSILFLLIAVLACVLSIYQDKNRLLNIVILAWLLPISVMVFWVTHFKYQYWMPVALPLFSSLVYFLPDKLSLDGLHNKINFKTAGVALAGIIIFAQWALFVRADIQRYEDRLHRADGNPAIQFYDLATKALDPIGSRDVKVYHDVQMYVPVTLHWETESTLKLLNYDYVQSNNFDVVLLMQQRIYDYLNPEAQGIDPGEFARSQIFYRDANEEALHGYHLAFRNEFGLVFVKDDMYNEFYENK